MLTLNPLIIALTGLIPMVIGAIYYSPAVMGKTWMRTSGTSEEKAASGNMILILGVAYVLSCLLAVFLTINSIHQFSIQSLFVMDESFEVAGSEMNNFMNDFMAKYGDRHRTFGHGAVHGGFLSLLVALPLIGIIANFERRGWKYIAVHWVYWFIALVLMSGVVCQFS